MNRPIEIVLGSKVEPKEIRNLRQIKVKNPDSVTIHGAVILRNVRHLEWLVGTDDFRNLSSRLQEVIKTALTELNKEVHRHVEPPPKKPEREPVRHERTRTRWEDRHTRYLQ